ncbi:antho-RFamide neuropeptides type 2-like [Xenia sp. Carnegie-2017]|uniref:antho-RFamide neuropeptides type 2-like n=1 Tax=Xenia sp. Carnegie-2017 TaxID=2897299 RepID=UPI001F04211A|nr:antho-RFamide neuropeptides type 2-like [Xenia sp. Carnegie-2017]
MNTLTLLLVSSILSSAFPLNAVEEVRRKDLIETVRDPGFDESLKSEMHFEQGRFGRENSATFDLNQGRFGREKQGRFGRETQGRFGRMNVADISAEVQGRFGREDKQGRFGRKVDSQGRFGRESTKKVENERFARVQFERDEQGRFGREFLNSQGRFGKK